MANETGNDCCVRGRLVWARLIGFIEPYQMEFLVSRLLFPDYRLLVLFSKFERHPGDIRDGAP